MTDILPREDHSKSIAHFCMKWRVARLWVFGSVARDAAKPDSDIDILAEFLPASTTSTWDWPQMQDELRSIFGRNVDLLSTGVLRNPFRRETIESTRKLLYAA